MNKLIAALAAAVVCASAAVAQNNPDYRMPEPAKNQSTYHDYTKYKAGFWFATELGAGYTVSFAGDKNIVPIEESVEGGYRFNDYIRVGIGAGFRYYALNDRIRRNTVAWSFPLYLTLRGNFMTHEYRSVVPFWDVDAGVAVHDGLMVRPTVGIRIGQMRQALTLGLSYLGQSMEVQPDKREFASGVMLRIGFEF